MAELQQVVAHRDEAALWAWPPKETARDEGWLLRAAGGHTRRANSVQALVFASGADLERAIGRVEAWYAQRGLPACFQLTDRAAPADLDADAGAARLCPADAGLGAAARRRRAGAAQGRADRARHPADAAGDERGLRSATGARPRAGRAPSCSRASAGRTCLPSLLDGIQPVAGGLCVVDGELAGIFSLRTAAAARGRGHARAVLRRLAAWGRGMGAQQLYLQVEDDERAGPGHGSAARRRARLRLLVPGAATLRPPEPGPTRRSAPARRAWSGTSR